MPIGNYSHIGLSAQALIDFEQDEDDVVEEAVGQTTATRQDILEMILQSLRADDSPLYILIDNELGQPSARGLTPRVPPSDAIRVCRGITEHIMAAVDQYPTMGD